MWQVSDPCPQPCQREVSPSALRWDVSTWVFPADPRGGPGCLVSFPPLAPRTCPLCSQGTNTLSGSIAPMDTCVRHFLQATGQ